MMMMMMILVLLCKVLCSDMELLTLKEISPHCFKTCKRQRGEVLLTVHRVLLKLMAIVRWRIVEIGGTLLVNGCTTLLQQRSRFKTE